MAVLIQISNDIVNVDVLPRFLAFQKGGGLLLPLAESRSRSIEALVARRRRDYVSVLEVDVRELLRRPDAVRIPRAPDGREARDLLGPESLQRRAVELRLSVAQRLGRLGLLGRAVQELVLARRELPASQRLALEGAALVVRVSI